MMKIFLQLTIWRKQNLFATGKNIFTRITKMQKVVFVFLLMRICCIFIRIFGRKEGLKKDIMNMNNSRIVLVDDDPINLMLYSKMLRESDYQIITATNGKECLELVFEKQPDLIVLDWNMPEMDGMEALEKLKENQQTKDIPVIMITGVMNSSDNLASAMLLGATDFLRKPFDKAELVARVRNTLLLTGSLNELKKQHQQLEDRNRFVSSLIQGIPQPVVHSSPEGILRLCNRAFEQLLNREQSELVGKSVYQYYLSDEVGVHIQKDVGLIQGTPVADYEAKVFPDNKTFMVSKNLVEDSHGHPVGIITVFSDITELKKNNEYILNSKKMELLSSTLQITHLSEMNNSMVEDLEKIIPYTEKQGREIIRQITNKFRINMADQIWATFEERFKNAFDEFYSLLLKKYPNLTLNERKLCALLRLELSSKDIAILTFQNPQSIDVARYRLRKKLGLSTEENLMDFLLTLDGQ